jgi:hypothetical protein
MQMLFFAFLRDVSIHIRMTALITLIIIPLFKWIGFGNDENMNKKKQ